MAENSKAGREPFERIKIVQDFCGEVYGVGACTATIENGKKKCFNTRATCQDPANYNRGTKTLHFVKDQIAIPKDGEYNIPSLRSVKIGSATINPAGGGKNSSALGTRATITASFQDHAHTDTIVDPYVSERSYDPLESGTFWTKWRARNPYYTNRPIIYESGYLLEDGTIEAESLITRTYFITDFNGVSANGALTIKGKDAFSLAANEKAKAPFVSKGKLNALLTAGATSATLTPSGIGSEYPASGKVRIGSEVAIYTISGDVMTLNRAENNTAAAEHKAGSGVQLCLEYDAQTPSDILYSLLNTYAGIDAAYLDKTNWDIEVTDYLPRLYSTLITEPTGVSSLVSEITEQMFFYTWWDERDSKVKIRSIRPVDEEDVTPLNDAQNLIQDSVSFSDKSGDLVTQAWIYYAQLDPTKKLDERPNYGAVEVVGDGDSESPDKYGKPFIKEVFSRWILDTGGGAAVDLGDKILARYKEVPRSASFSLDAKDNNIRLGDFVAVDNRLSVDDEGQAKPVNLQILSEAETIAGTTYKFMAQQFVYESVPTSGDKNVIISSDIINLNLLDAYNEQFGVAPVSGDVVNIVIRSGVKVGGRYQPNNTTFWPTFTGNRVRIRPTGFNPYYVESVKITPTTRRGITTPIKYTASVNPPFVTGSTTPSGKITGTDMWLIPVATSLDTGIWPAGVVLKLTIEAGAIVTGHGGNGGQWYNYQLNGSLYATSTETPSHGGYAMEIRSPLIINNLGVISGGANGGGLSVQNVEWKAPHYVAMGYGGSGYPAGSSMASFINEAENVFTSPVVKGSVRVDRNASAGASFEVTRTSQTSLVSWQTSAGRQNVYSSSPSSDLSPSKHAIKSGASLITWENKGNVYGTETP